MTERKDKLLEIVYKMTNSLMRASDMQRALESVCEIIVDSGLAKFAWIGFAEEETKTIKPIAKAGAEHGYLSVVKITYDSSKFGMGPTGRSIKSGRPRIVRSIETDPTYAPWRFEALKRGFKSSMSVPLFAKRKALGTLNVYRGEADAFSKDDVRLFEDLSRNLSLSVMNFREIEKRKNTEKDLMDGGEKFRALFEEAPIGIVLGANKTITYANKAVLRIFGYDDESELQGKNYQVLVAPQSREYIQGLSEQLHRGKKLLGEYEIVGQRKNGSQIVLSTRVEMLKLRGENLIISFFNDITKRKMAEASLIASETRFRQLVENSPAAILIYQDDKVVYANPEAERISSYTKEDIMKMASWDIVHPDLREQTKKKMRQAEAGSRSSGTNEIRILTKNGESRWLSASVSPILYNGRHAMVFMAHDITEHKRLDEALQESEKKYRSIVNNAKDIIITLTSSGVITSANPAVYYVGGWRPADLIGKHFKGFVHPEDLKIIVKNVDKILNKETPPRHRARFLKKSGGIALGDVISSPMISEGKVTGMLVTIRLVNNVNNRNGEISKSKK